MFAPHVPLQIVLPILDLPSADATAQHDGLTVGRPCMTLHAPLFCRPVTAPLIRALDRFDVLAYMFPGTCCQLALHCWMLACTYLSSDGVSKPGWLHGPTTPIGIQAQ